MQPERWIYKLPLRIRSIFDRQNVGAELDEELRDHVELKTQQYIAAGMTPQEARRAASLEMGGLEKHKDQCRDARQVNHLENFFRDIRFGFRMLCKSPFVTVVVTIAIALGVGANTAIFSVVNGSLLRSLPVPSPEQITVLAIQQKDAPVGLLGFFLPPNSLIFANKPARLPTYSGSFSAQYSSSQMNTRRNVLQTTSPEIISRR